MLPKDGRTILIGQLQYHIQDSHISASPLALKRLASAFTRPFIAATAIAWGEPVFEQQDLLKVGENYRAQDDVWCEDFTDVLLLLRTTRADCDVKTTQTICVNNAEAGLPVGPLVVERDTGHIFLVSRLFQDPNFAFVSAIAPTTNSRPGFHELPREGQVQIAVPSRLYSPRSSVKPLAGLRFGVKDSIALKGLKTGFGSWAWYEVHEPETFTAPCVQRLIDAGAIVVGKVVSSEFCEGVEPAEWTQGICPFNPRGDGQQKPSSSSTGSAVAAAAYDWLDFTLGTDTGGSVRHPAGVNGVFGQRPTTGTVDLEGVLGATDLFNTVGVFARCPQVFGDVGSCLVGSTKQTNLSQRRYQLLCPTRNLPNSEGTVVGEGRWFPHPNAASSTWDEGENMVEKLVCQLEAHLDCQRTYVSLYDFWAATAPEGQPKSLDKATGKIYGDITTSFACVNGIDKFVAQYQAKHEGRQPEMSSVVKSRFQHGRSLCNDQISGALEATNAFKQWMETTFFNSEDEDTTTIIVFPQSRGKPEYRDDRSRWAGNLFIESFSVYALGYLCGCPDYTIPIGELPYLSRVTHQTEYLPVSFSIAGKPGTDRELFDVVQQLHQAGILHQVQAGQRMFAEKASS